MLTKKSLLVLFAITSGVSGFTTHPTTFIRNTQPSRLFAGQDDKEGGAAIAKPKVGVKVETVTKQKVKSVEKQKTRASDPISRRKDEFEDAPLYKVILIGDEDYDQAHVIERMCEILDGMDENQAATIFKQAQQGGKAMCGKYPFEYAELYKERLQRSDPMIFSDVEEDKNDQKKK